MEKIGDIIEKRKGPEPKKVVDSIWFGKIGIVKYRNGFTMKLYIGVGFGFDQDQDAKFIVENGVPFSIPESFYSITNK